MTRKGVVSNSRVPNGLENCLLIIAMDVLYICDHSWLHIMASPLMQSLLSLQTSQQVFQKLLRLPGSLILNRSVSPN